MAVKNKRSRAEAPAETLPALAEQTGVTLERVIRELALIAFSNAADVVDFDTAGAACGASREDTAAIASVKVEITPRSDGEHAKREIKLYDKLKALELLGRHLSMFGGPEGPGGEGVHIVDDIPSDAG